MRAFATSTLCVLIAAIPAAPAQDVFAGGDNNGPTESFNGGNGDNGPDDFADRERYRPLPGYTNCGPWYNNYNNFVRAMMQHYGGLCEVRNGNQVWCHARIAGTCNADATGGRPDSPILDTGVRYTPQCQTVCDRSVSEPASLPPPPSFQTPVLHQPIDQSPDDLPCAMPSLEQLAQPVESGDVPVAYAPSDIGGDVAIAQALPPDDGDIAVALALPAQTTLTGGIQRTDTFLAPQPPPTGKALKPFQLRAFVTKSLRVPVTYQPTRAKPVNTSPAFQQAETRVLRGGIDTYDAEVGKQRFIAGFTAGLQSELRALNRYGHERRDNAQKQQRENAAKQSGKACEIRGTASPVFGNPNPVTQPLAAAKFVTDMIQGLMQDARVKQTYPNLQKVPLVGTLVGGANLVSNYVGTFSNVMLRDTRLREALDSAQYASRELDPRDVGYLAGQQFADAYQFYINGSFSF